MKAKRPFSIILLSLVCLGMGILSLSRLWQALAQWAFLTDLLPFPPAYLALSGALWGALCLFLAAILFLGVHRAPRLARLFIIGYSGYYWLEYSLLVEHTGRPANWPFLAAANLGLVLWAIWVLSRPAARTYFGEKNE